jgi:hypothetical protein
MAMPTNPEKQHSLNSPAEAPSAVVSQPMKIDLSGQLGSFLEEIGRISETASSGAGEQGTAGTGGAMTQTSGGSTTAVSARDQAIANLPGARVMQKQLEAHIKTEIRKLRKQAKTIARINQPGGAYHLNMLYLRIHHLNALLAELLSSSVEVLKRLFIRVFIDKQTVL